MPVVVNEFEVLPEPGTPAAPAAPSNDAGPVAPSVAQLQPLLEQLAREAHARAQRVQEHHT